MNKIIRDHYFFAFDFNKEDEDTMNAEFLTKIEELLENSESEGIIKQYHFGYNFAEDVTREYENQKRKLLENIHSKGE